MYEILGYVLLFGLAFIAIILLNIGWHILIGKGCEVGAHDYSTGGYQNRDGSGRVSKVCCKCWHEKWFYPPEH